MHRKLIHSVRALGIALSLLTAGLVTAGLVTAGLSLAVPATAPDGMAADAGVAPTAAANAQATTSAAKAHLRHRTQARDAMALPFFSFAQGLRRGNRSRS
jgi:fructose-1,6-bisphosphatase/sedoheptulose 1,7-bisphosphatase-like protein